MKRIYGLLLVILVVQCAALAQPTRYVVLISIDGLRPEFYNMDGWDIPNLQELAKNGASAWHVRSVYPSLTYPAHTTLVTGALPVHHGIYFNERFEPGTIPTHWYWECSLIKTPTLWEAVHKSGRTSAAISWPVTVGAPIDHNIPEYWSLDKKVDKVTPIREASTPKGFFEEIEQYATGKLTDNDVDNAYLTMDENIGRIASYTIRKYKPALTAIHFVCADHFQHTDGTNSTMVHKAVASVDREIQKIIEAFELAGIKDSTAIIITGDHGFHDISTSFAPNTWLAQEGLITKKDGKLDWKAYFHTCGPSAFLHLKYKEDVETERKVRHILDNLTPAYKKMFRIIDRKQLDSIGADPDAILAIDPAPGFTVNSATDGPEIKKVYGGAHGYYPTDPGMYTGFIAYGAPFVKGMVLSNINLEDIATVISSILHLDFKAPDGKVPSGIFN